jgi:hypothetical protein
MTSGKNEKRVRQPSQVMGLPTEIPIDWSKGADETPAYPDISYWRTGVQLRALWVRYKQMGLQFSRVIAVSWGDGNGLSGRRLKDGKSFV